jgi:hypothetical protein
MSILDEDETHEYRLVKVTETPLSAWTPDVKSLFRLRDKLDGDYAEPNHLEVQDTEGSTVTPDGIYRRPLSSIPNLGPVRDEGECSGSGLTNSTTSPTT